MSLSNKLPFKINTLFYCFLKLSGNDQQDMYENGIKAYVFNVDTKSHVSVKNHGSYEVISSWQHRAEQQRLIGMIQSK